MVEASPVWVAPHQNENGTYLSNLKYTGDSGSLQIQNLMSGNAMKDLKQQYEDRNRDYEFKKSYGLTGMLEEQQHSGDMHDLGRQMLGAARNFQTQKELKQVETNASQNQGLQPFIKPAGVVAGGAAIATGQQPVKLKIDDSTRFESNTNVRNQTGQFSLTSKIVNMQMNADLTHYDPGNPYEHYQLSMSRVLPIWDLAASVGYGLSMSCMTASLTKSLYKNLSTSVDTTRPLQPGASDPEESFHLNYGLSF